jgi:6-phosphogluconolactonase/glucosamine-6-phosphate isomerase/deaminase
MIEAEWWEYDSLDELADAVAGDVGFIIESAVDARDASLIAVPGGKTGPAIFSKLAKQSSRPTTGWSQSTASFRTCAVSPERSYRLARGSSR